VTELANVIRTAALDLLAVQEVGDEQSFEALRRELGPGWAGVLSTHFETPHTIRVGWLSPGDLTAVEEVVDLPAALSPVTVGDDGTTLTQFGRGALAVTYTTTAGTPVRALTAHLKSKLLSFPGASGVLVADDSVSANRRTSPPQRQWTRADSGHMS
jgi:endonuclease/exonuclease/phosphatase family metal-dependent hydrolase